MIGLEKKFTIDDSEEQPQPQPSFSDRTPEEHEAFVSRCTDVLMTLLRGGALRSTPWSWPADVSSAPTAVAAAAASTTSGELSYVVPSFIVEF